MFPFQSNTRDRSYQTFIHEKLQRKQNHTFPIRLLFRSTAVKFCLTSLRYRPHFIRRFKRTSINVILIKDLYRFIKMLSFPRILRIKSLSVLQNFTTARKSGKVSHILKAFFVRHSSENETSDSDRKVVQNLYSQMRKFSDHWASKIVLSFKCFGICLYQDSKSSLV